jgi:hypothetical protein
MYHNHGMHDRKANSVRELSNCDWCHLLAGAVWQLPSTQPAKQAGGPGHQPWSQQAGGPGHQPWSQQAGGPGHQSWSQQAGGPGHQSWSAQASGPGQPTWSLSEEEAVMASQLGESSPLGLLTPGGPGRGVTQSAIPWNTPVSDNSREGGFL